MAECVEGLEQLSLRGNDAAGKMALICEPINIIIIGKTGAGKSTLINNIFAEDIVKPGDSLDRGTNCVTSITGQVDGLRVTIYDTPGLEDRDPIAEETHMTQIKGLIQGSTPIHLAILCISMKDTRVEESHLRTFTKYTELGLNWDNSVIALTFADEFHLKPTLKDKRAELFPDKVKEWKEKIKEALIQTGLKFAVANKLKKRIYPTTHTYEEKLPNGDGWYDDLWYGVFRALEKYAGKKFLVIHLKHMDWKQDGEKESKEESSDYKNTYYSEEQPVGNSTYFEEQHGRNSTYFEEPHHGGKNTSSEEQHGGNSTYSEENNDDKRSHPKPRISFRQEIWTELVALKDDIVDIAYSAGQNIASFAKFVYSVPRDLVKYSYTKARDLSSCVCDTLSGFWNSLW